MNKNNAYMFTTDAMLIAIYDANETLELFGGDMLLDFGTYIPNELIERYKNNIKERNDIQKELKKINDILTKF